MLASTRLGRLFLMQILGWDGCYFAFRLFFNHNFIFKIALSNFQNFVGILLLDLGNFLEFTLGATEDLAV